jgi:hypothetical protein
MALLSPHKELATGPLSKPPSIFVLINVAGSTKCIWLHARHVSETYGRRPKCGFVEGSWAPVTIPANGLDGLNRPPSSGIDPRQSIAAAGKHQGMKFTPGQDC